jgi:SAM-dependent methyltransferase
LPDPYDWAAIDDDSFDVVISGQAFEHIEYVWLSILEIARVLRTNGLVALIAPGAGPVHRYPTDCWRYYPDGFPALVRYAGLTVVESHLQRRYAYPDSDSILWCDAMVVAQKPWRTPAEQADWARRIRAAQQMIKPGFDPAILGTLQDVAKERPVSRLAPTRSLDAIRRREEERLAMLPRFKTKATVATRHLRAAVRAFRQSLNENVAIL